jgi:hypothetical protein
MIQKFRSVAARNVEGFVGTAIRVHFFDQVKVLADEVGPPSSAFSKGIRSPLEQCQVLASFALNPFSEAYSGCLTVKTGQGHIRTTFSAVDPKKR